MVALVGLDKVTRRYKLDEIVSCVRSNVGLEMKGNLGDAIRVPWGRLYGLNMI